MTRQEFIDNITTWWELIDWCRENECHICEDIYDDDSYYDYINDNLVDWAREDSWTELRDRLNDLPSGYDFYQRDDYGDFHALDDYGDFDAFFDEVLSWGDDNNIWEDAEEESPVNNEDEEAEDDEDGEPVEIEDFSFGELFSVCSSAVQRITEENADAAAKAKAAKETEEEEFEEEFDSFISGIMNVVEGRA